MKSILYLLFTIFTISCSIIDPELTPSFVVNNESSEEIASVKIFAQDGDVDKAKNTGNFIAILAFSNMESKSKTDLSEVKLKDFSKTGEGHLSVEITLKSGEKVKTGLGLYKNNRIFTEFVPKT